ncbi:MAG: ABC transporter substrate-binding protein, partial [Candidatus Eremiobacteraeota bacterium]|nr:ABC transporter substrate-binding protein [Candidatus Eremiobacteraeota bacterium]
MKDETQTIASEASTRSEFLRRTGALGIAGAAVLGFPLLETRLAGAAPLAPPRDIIAAGGGATVKIGHIDGFSGVYAAASQSQQDGLQLAIDEANRANSRIKFVIVRGDDASQPAVGSNEAKRLISQEKVDVLVGCLSSGVGLAVSAIAEESGVFFMAIGTHDTNITGPKANKVTFRATCSSAMLASAVGPALLKKGKKWYFITADYAFGNDAHDRLAKILTSAGGSEAGNDRHPLGQTDYSSYMTKARNTDADVLVMCNYGPDTENAVKAAVGLGLNKKMSIGGILCGNEAAVGMPVDELVGSLWGYVWGPDAGGAKTMEIYNKLKPLAKGYPPNWRQYLGYIVGQQVVDRLHAAGTTDTAKLIAAFEDHRYEAGKKDMAQWRK